jgi:hypothetical protein
MSASIAQLGANSFHTLYSGKVGGRRRKDNWIQGVVSKMDKGAFTKQALRDNQTPSQYANDVLKHPKRHTLKTRRRAQFLKNIRKKTHRRK